MDFPRRLGEALRRLRLNLKKSQGGVAKTAGLSQGALSRIERGLMPITVECLLRLSAALEVRPWAVLAYADYLEPTKLPDQLEVIASVLAWAEYDPVAWRQTCEVLLDARGRGGRWDVVRTLLAATSEETMP